MQLPPPANGQKQTIDRRSRPRVSLSWRVRLLRISDRQFVVTQTSNLSSGGFWCRSPVPFRQGDDLECTFELADEHGAEPVELRCRASVLRVAPSDCDSGYGLACQLNDYILSAPIAL